jgi:hypothetical protein
MPYLDGRYADYGQCKNVASRLKSPWWKEHITSFGMRQITTYERELGWAFWTYKLDAEAEEKDPSSHFWSFRLAAAAGYIETENFGKDKDYCQFTPPADYALGDDAPPPPPPTETETETPLMTPPSSSFTGLLSLFVVMGALVVVLRQAFRGKEGSGEYARVPTYAHEHKHHENAQQYQQCGGEGEL